MYAIYLHRGAISAHQANLYQPSQFKDRIEKDYPEMYDEICEGREVPSLLYILRIQSR